MSERNKKLAAILGLIIVLVLSFFFLKKNPAIVKQIENAITPAVAGTFDVPEIGAYTPHDFPLPALSLGDVFLNSGCNFCSKVSVAVVPPSMPISAPASPTPMQISPTLPFGGGGAQYYTSISMRA